MRSVSVAVGVVCLVLQFVATGLANDPVLVRVVTREPKSHVGELLSDVNQNVRLFDIALNTEVTVPKDQVLRVTNPIGVEDAARSVGLPAFAAWQISKLPESETKTGKIAKVTTTAIYLTLKEGEVAVDQKLEVYRRKEEIKDPDTGEILAVERPRIAELKVTEVNGAYSKATLTGNLEVELLTGDEVELPGAGERKIAVCPLYLESGDLTNIGAQLSEDLTTLLVNRNVKVVERAKLLSVLGELVLQNTILFDSKDAQKLGQQTGASHVVVGKIVRSGGSGKAYMRLVDVATGEICYAASTTVSLSNAHIVSLTKSKTDSTPPESPAAMRREDGADLDTGGKRERLGQARTLPKAFTTQGQYRRDDGGVTAVDSQTPIRTKVGTYLNKDFEFEVLIEIKHPRTLAYIGIGTGLPRPGGSEPLDSVNLRIHSPEISNGQVVLASDSGGSREEIGHLQNLGTHLIRIVKEGDSLTFIIDPDGDGPTDDDIETTIADVRQFAPSLNSKNTYIFFSSQTGRDQPGAIFKEVSLTTK